MAAADLPVLVGVAQLVERESDPLRALEPLAMLERVARAAAEDSGAGSAALDRIDTLVVPSIAGWRARNAPDLLARRLGCAPAQAYTSQIGGQIGVTAANHVAERIAAGQTRVALIASANNLKTLARARRAGVELPWQEGGEGEPESLDSFKPGNSDDERRHGLRGPTDVYPLFENALRAERGLDLTTHTAGMARLFSRFTSVAASNPYAWFPTPRSPEALAKVTATNRMIGFPYPKYLNAVLDTDQAAALLLTSTSAARALGIPEARWIYWRGGAEANEEAWFASERPDFARCPAMLDASASALARARVAIDEVDRIDFYSCFPIAVEIACLQLGLAEDDPRGFTVTGGLPYAGGPASGYTLHSLAAMAEALRAAPGDVGLVTGNGWYLTKHAASVWSTQAPGTPPRRGLIDPLPSAGMPHAAVVPTPEAEGALRVETYTVIHDREGAPVRGIVIGRLEDGRRCIANTPDDRGLLEALVAEEQVGATGRVRFDGERNRFAPD